MGEFEQNIEIYNASLRDSMRAISPPNIKDPSHAAWVTEMMNRRHSGNLSPEEDTLLTEEFSKTGFSGLHSMSFRGRRISWSVSNGPGWAICLLISIAALMSFIGGMTTLGWCLVGTWYVLQMLHSKLNRKL